MKSDTSFSTKFSIFSEHKLSSSEVSALKKASSSVIEDYISRTGGSGGVGDKLVKAANKL